MRAFDPSKTYLITGGAGFIGFHLSKKLLEQGARVVGFDNMNDYYDVKLKRIVWRSWRLLTDIAL